MYDTFMQCGKKFIFLERKDSSQTFHMSIRLRCNSWSCPYCAKRKASRLRKAIVTRFGQKSCYMLTLTLDQKETLEQAWSKINSKWNILNTLTKQQGYTYSYIRVIEPHKKKPYPHIHVIIDNFQAASFMQKKCVVAGFGWNAHILCLPSKTAASYAAKYCCKFSENKLAWSLRGKFSVRVVNCSRDIKLRVKSNYKYKVISPILPKSMLLFYWQYLIMSYGNSDNVRLSSTISNEVQITILMNEAEYNYYFPDGITSDTSNLSLDEFLLQMENL
jgi:hypothetical protein